MSITAKLTNGLLVFERYRLKRLLGRGGMGVVWLAHDIELEKDIALKFLTENLLFDSTAIKDLKKETRRGMELAHPNIIRVYGFFSSEDRAAIAMEYVEGNNLSSLRDTREGHYFEVDEIASWTLELCSALHYAHTHAEIVHRDLKPANLMIDHKNRLKIADFGISASLSDAHTRLTGTMGLRGTMLYMGPQQLLGQRPCVTHDIYALGATLYDLLTGKPVFHTGDVSLQVRESIPPSIAARRAELGIQGLAIPDTWEETIAACLSKDAADRPASAAEVVTRLCLTGDVLTDGGTPLPVPMYSIDPSRPLDPTVRESSGPVVVTGRPPNQPSTAAPTVQEAAQTANTQTLNVGSSGSHLSGLVVALLVIGSVVAGGAVAYFAFLHGSMKATIEANSTPMISKQFSGSGDGQSGPPSQRGDGYRGPRGATSGAGYASRPDFGADAYGENGPQDVQPSRGVPNRVSGSQTMSPEPGHDFALPGSGMIFRWAPPFEFMIGSPRHNPDYEVNLNTLVTFSQGFWFCQHEVTQREYELVMGENPSYFKGGKLPVQNVSWNDAMAFCQKFNEKYADLIPEGYTFSLPTQAQFEFASLGGINGFYGRRTHGDYGWSDENAGGQPHDVGLLLPNEFDIYDTVGNVAEWVLDWYAPLPGGNEVDYSGPATGEEKVVRGASFLDAGHELRVSRRWSFPPDYEDSSVGFRVALVPINDLNRPLSQ
ncbi:bifunctional serine/threonine-protein kinase/formylglycine-generating enzyme family protein [Cerasicoccus frondis]|uniref:bifunctional serine/threonine-protein kinase/formylglycine-generating enzyme family protein n=1 Tax=Cerasicoccus frondis TaxID=490090 RepID=UPI0028524B9D|nr:bifunctional serine/threonine-protein kinase/formylglycine-generating enzyme family protein [Cerasicoccus frondis]